MLYYRSTKDSAGRRPMTMKMLRLLATAPLAAYPAGCVILLNAPADNLLAQLIGFAFILIALLGAALVLPSWIQRIAGEEKDKLDEFELDQRRRAYSAAYHAFTALTLIFVAYLGVVSDAQEQIAWLWTPSTFDHWNAVFWGVFLFASLLPSAWLAWTIAPPVEEE